MTLENQNTQGNPTSDLSQANEDNLGSENSLLNNSQPSEIDIEANELTLDAIDSNNIVSDIDQNISVKDTESLNSNWQDAIGWFVFLSEFFNTGIVYDIASKQIPAIRYPELVTASWIFEALIYVFKIMVRLTYLVGENKNSKIVFNDRKNGKHKHQSAADFTCALFFGLTIPLLLGVHVLPPYDKLIAWSLGISGLSVSAYFDYRYQAILAEQALNLLDYNTDSEAYRKKITNEYKTAERAKKGFYGLIVGLILLLICDSAADVTPANVAQYLKIISQVTGVFLTGVAGLRFYNYITSPDALQKIQAKYNKICEYTASCCGKKPMIKVSHPSPKLSSKPSSPMSTGQTNVLMSIASTTQMANTPDLLLPSGFSITAEPNSFQKKPSSNDVELSTRTHKYSFTNNMAHKNKANGKSPIHDEEKSSLLRSNTATN